MTLPRVFATRPLPQQACERVAMRCALSVNPQDVPLPSHELVEACRDVEGLMNSGSRWLRQH